MNTIRQAETIASDGFPIAEAALENPNCPFQRYLRLRGVTPHGSHTDHSVASFAHTRSAGSEQEPRQGEMRV